MEELKRYKARHQELFDNLCTAIADPSVPTRDLKPILDAMDDVEVTIRYCLKELQSERSSNE
jgi:hypothetical protein